MSDLDTRMVSVNLNGLEWEGLREVIHATLDADAPTDADILDAMEVFADEDYDGFPLVLPVYVARAFAAAVARAEASATDAHPLPFYADEAGAAIEDAIARLADAPHS